MSRLVQILKQGVLSWADKREIDELLRSPDVVADIAADDNEALRYAAERGHLDVVNRLLVFPTVVENITANKNEALRWAAYKGRLDVVNRLLAFEAVVDDIAADDSYALRLAAGNGHLDVVSRLLAFPTVVENITANNNEALRWAAQGCHFAIVSRLLEFPAVVENIATHDNIVLCYAVDYGLLAFVNRLLAFPAVVASITAINNEVLRRAALGGHLDIVNRLLAFPAVVENITANNNEALRWAAGNGHTAVVARLMGFPAVRQAVLRADDADVSLRALAQDSENAMRALNLQEQGIIYALYTRYPSLSGKTTQVEAQADTLNDLRAHLETSCNAQNLSLSFDKDNPNAPISNIQHQAWRYLFARPNPWMSPNAGYVEETARGRQAHIFDKDWNLMALIWTLLNDKDAKLSADNNDLIENEISTAEEIRENLKETFFGIVGLSARAHNYDHDDQTDDGDLDKPSCAMGVTLRLLQVVSGFEIAEKPETRLISADHIAKRFKEQLVTNTEKGMLPNIKAMSATDLSTLNATLEKLVAGDNASGFTEDEERLLIKLAISTEATDSFIKTAKEFYTDLRFLALDNISYQGEQYDNADSFIKALAAKPWSAFLAETYQFVRQERESRPVESKADMEDVAQGVFNLYRKRKSDDEMDSPIISMCLDGTDDDKKPKFSPAA